MPAAVFSEDSPGNRPLAMLPLVLVLALLIALVATDGAGER
jgi:hypothetical protein